MIDWFRFKSKWHDEIKRRHPEYDFKVDNLGNKIKVTLFRAPIRSYSRYFPFGKFYLGLQNKMTPEMFEFWADVDKIREDIAQELDFKHLDMFRNLSSSYDWEYSIGSADHDYIDSKEFLERAKDIGVSEQLMKDAEQEEMGEDHSEERKISSMILIFNELLALANKLDRRR